MRRLALLAFAVLALSACDAGGKRPIATTTTSSTATGSTSATATATAAATASAPGRVDPATLPDVVKLKGAAGKSGARYANPLAAFDEPQDAKNMSDYSEYGWREALTDQNSDAFKEFGPTPAGWWIYVKPYWIVYNFKDGKTGP